MSRRESNLQDQFTIITNATKQSILILENITLTLQNEIFQEFNENKKNEWNNKIISNSKDTANLIYNVNIAEEILSELGKRKPNEDNNNNTITATTTTTTKNNKNNNNNNNDKSLKELQNEIETKIQKYDNETADNVKKIRQIIFVIFYFSYFIFYFIFYLFMIHLFI